MRAILVTSLGMAVALASCQSTATIDTAIQKNLPRTCALLETAHAAFLAASVSGRIPERTVAKEAAAYNGVYVICADPTRVTAANALVVVATAYATVSLALREAKSHE